MSRPHDWFLGIDLGTGSCKSAVVDADARVIGFGAASYAGANTQTTWKEQDPHSMVAGLIRAVRSAIAQAGVEPAACQGLSLGSALHTIMALDRAGQPLTGVITWADGRSARQAQAIKKSSEALALYNQTGCPANGMYPLYKICWLREERPDIFRQAARFVTAKEYVFEKLTGQQVVDCGVASGSGLLNIHRLDWNPLSLDIAGISAGQLAPLSPPLTTFSGLTPGLAEGLGLPVRTRLVLGSSDAANSSIGAGAIQPWQATCMIGTSGALRVVAPRPSLDAQARLWCYVADETHWLIGGAINNGGIAFAWLKDALAPALAGQPESRPLTFDDLAALAAEVEVGAHGLICLPFLAGERSPNWNENARAAFVGLTLQHDIRHLARAVLEGVAFRMRSLSEILASMTGDVREVRASGGFTHSALWPQIVASVLNRDLRVPVWGETSALGAAFWAMRGAGALPTIESAAERVTLGAEFHPAPAEAATYDQIYPIYSELYRNLVPSFDQIAEFQRGRDTTPSHQRP